MLTFNFFFILNICYNLNGDYMKIGFASDHRGFNLKNELVVHYKKESDYTVVDCGTNTPDSCDYPDYAHALCEKVLNGDVDFGVAICGSGIGISIACNKHKGIYCAKVNNHIEAKYTREDNDTNVVAFSENTLLEDAIEIVDTFVTTPFSGADKHIRRIEKIKEIEKKN